jgi:hypothetical protein
MFMSPTCMLGSGTQEGPGGSYTTIMIHKKMVKVTYQKCNLEYDKEEKNTGQ